MFQSILVGSFKQYGQEPLFTIKFVDTKNPISKKFHQIIQKKVLLTSSTQEIKTCNNKLELTSFA